MVVSFMALFVALGGASYAATQLPANSVGTAQIQNGSVGNWKLKSNAVGARKIINGSVGAKQVESSQVQLRVASSCSTGAISAVGLSGSVTCTPTVGNEYGSNTAATTVGSSATQVASESLVAGSSYLVMAYPHVVITRPLGPARRGRLHAVRAAGLGHPAAGQPDDHDEELCGRPRSSTRSIAGTIPLVLPVASSTSIQPATVNCMQTTTGTPATPAPTVAVDTTISAIQTASNN